jgi:hypothetical protein
VRKTRPDCLQQGRGDQAGEERRRGVEREVEEGTAEVDARMLVRDLFDGVPGKEGEREPGEDREELGARWAGVRTRSIGQSCAITCRGARPRRR